MATKEQVQFVGQILDRGIANNGGRDIGGVPLFESKHLEAEPEYTADFVSLILQNKDFFGVTPEEVAALEQIK